jgi:DNA-binding protein H-NS
LVCCGLLADPTHSGRAFCQTIQPDVESLMSKHYENMSEAELQSMIEDASRALKDKQQGKRREVIAQIKQLAASIGVGVEIIDGAASSPRKGRKVPIKFQNPDNLSEQWSGRGVRPKWLQNLLNQGRRLDEFEVQS